MTTKYKKLNEQDCGIYFSKNSGDGTIICDICSLDVTYTPKHVHIHQHNQYNNPRIPDSHKCTPCKLAVHSLETHIGQIHPFGSNMDKVVDLDWNNRHKNKTEKGDRDSDDDSDSDSDDNDDDDDDDDDDNDDDNDDKNNRNTNSSNKDRHAKPTPAKQTPKKAPPSTSMTSRPSTAAPFSSKPTTTSTPATAAKKKAASTTSTTTSSAAPTASTTTPATNKKPQPAAQPKQPAPAPPPPKPSSLLPFNRPLSTMDLLIYVSNPPTSAGMTEQEVLIQDLDCDAETAAQHLRFGFGKYTHIDLKDPDHFAVQRVDQGSNKKKFTFCLICRKRAHFSEDKLHVHSELHNNYFDPKTTHRCHHCRIGCTSLSSFQSHYRQSHLDEDPAQCNQPIFDVLENLLYRGIDCEGEYWSSMALPLPALSTSIISTRKDKAKAAQLLEKQKQRQKEKDSAMTDDGSDHDDNESQMDQDELQRQTKSTTPATARGGKPTKTAPPANNRRQQPQLPAQEPNDNDDDEDRNDDNGAGDDNQDDGDDNQDDDDNDDNDGQGESNVPTPARRGPKPKSKDQQAHSKRQRQTVIQSLGHNSRAASTRGAVRSDKTPLKTPTKQPGRQQPPRGRQQRQDDLDEEENEDEDDEDEEDDEEPVVTVQKDVVATTPPTTTATPTITPTTTTTTTASTRKRMPTQHEREILALKQQIVDQDDLIKGYRELLSQKDQIVEHSQQQIKFKEEAFAEALAAFYNYQAGSTQSNSQNEQHHELNQYNLYALQARVSTILAYHHFRQRGDLQPALINEYVKTLHQLSHPPLTAFNNPEPLFTAFLPTMDFLLQSGIQTARQDYSLATNHNGSNSQDHLHPFTHDQQQQLEPMDTSDNLINSQFRLQDDEQAPALDGLVHGTKRNNHHLNNRHNTSTTMGRPNHHNEEEKDGGGGCSDGSGPTDNDEGDQQPIKHTHKKTKNPQHQQEDNDQEEVSLT